MCFSQILYLSFSHGTSSPPTANISIMNKSYQEMNFNTCTYSVCGEYNFFFVKTWCDTRKSPITKEAVSLYGEQ